MLPFSLNTSTHSKLQNLYRIEFTTLSFPDLTRDGFFSTQFFFVFSSFTFRLIFVFKAPAFDPHWRFLTDIVFNRHRFVVLGFFSVLSEATL